jgi:hypothetical protein
MNPYYQQVLAVIGDTQDGGKININDPYGKFLYSIIKQNSNIEETDSAGHEAAIVNIEEVADNLRYAIHEFTKALKAAENMALICNPQPINS